MSLPYQCSLLAKHHGHKPKIINTKRIDKEEKKQFYFDLKSVYERELPKESNSLNSLVQCTTLLIPLTAIFSRC